MTDDKRYQELASKWLNGSITDAEKSEFAAWYQAHSDGQFEIPTSFAGSEEALRDRILTNVRENMHSKTIRVKNRGLRRAVRIAAAILFVFSTGVGLWLANADKEGAGVPLVQHDVYPGGNRAMLTLADGRTITLSAEQSGIVVDDDIRYEGGGLVDGSAVSSGEENPESQYNVITTPKGGQYQIKLADGSRVWLNSASSLRYPTKFAADRREVELLEGEAYFEVNQQVSPFIHSRKVPFRVIGKSQTVDVLGTQFNINAYADEKGIKTTLVEGSISIHAHRQTKTLTPGQQAVLADDNGMVINEVDTEPFTAWKDGFFYFNDADIYTVMKQFERWYDIKVQYDIGYSDDLFIGKIPKAVTLSTALNVLKSAGVNFEMKEGGHLIVKPRK